MLTLNKQYENNNFDPNRIWFWLIVLSAILGIGFLHSCKPSLGTKIKHYQKVAQDVQPISETKKALLAGVIAANFPIRERIKDSIIVKTITDTSKYRYFRNYILQLNQQLESKSCPQLNVDSIFKLAAETITPTTIFETKIRLIETKDTVGMFLLNRKLSELQSLIAQKDAEIANKDQRNKDAVQDKNNAESSRNKLIWWLVILGIVFIASHYIRTKIKAFTLPSTIQKWIK